MTSTAALDADRVVEAPGGRARPGGPGGTADGTHPPDAAACAAPPARTRRNPPFGVPVPAGGSGTCGVCHGPAAAPARVCWCCRRLERQLGEPVPPVVPVCLYRPGDAVHATLRGYKDAVSAQARDHHAARLAGAVADFLSVHGPCLVRLAGAVDALCTVPALRHRGPAGDGRASAPGSGARPMHDVLLRALAAAPAISPAGTVLLVPGAEPVSHLHAAPGAFRLAAPPRPGTRVLLVDDTWTTGAHAGSAAAAVRAAGCSVAAVLVAGRVVQPSASPAVRDWWRRALGSAVRPPSPDEDHRHLLASATTPCCLAWCHARRTSSGEPR